jgi:hypothetical protein
MSSEPELPKGCERFDGPPLLRKMAKAAAV